MDYAELKTKKIGWIGTGVMGESMCRHIMHMGLTTYVFNRTKDKTASLVQDGSIWCGSPKEVTEKADIIFTIVGYPIDVENVYFSENGILAAAAPGKIFIDMTTTKPSLAQKIYTEAKKHACMSIDAPVSGGDVGAKEARLAIMAGGDRETYNYILPLFEAMGKNIVYEGAAGSGQHTKMCNQITIAGTMIGVCEALLYGYKAGLDITVMLETISKGAAGCWSLDNLAPRIAAGNFSPGFFVEHFIKDMEIALEEAAYMEISLPGLALVHQLYIGLKAAGHGKSGTQALILALANLSGNTIGGFNNV
ncbi:MAG: NAD(P)-dependent oxidoreductase [Spirochaetia bacterium]|nr:NAD(P)-dependent oxidoreductase [Spirochaetia bacterium]